ncbi:MAG: ankyrin repeat domain-containing protein [Acidimicrobiales bacterium]
MPTVPLPNEPNLEQLRRQAKELRDAVRSGEARALAWLEEHHPAGAPKESERAKFSLSATQLVIARRYGFPSWPRLKQHLDVVAEFMRAPGKIPPADNPVDEFLRISGLNYADDGPGRWVQARQLLREHPEITELSIHAAAAANDVEHVRRHLRADPALAGVEGGPFAWPPLLYLTYSRAAPDASSDAAIDIARLLLNAGADPDAGYLWLGLPSPFTALTGVFGEGELGPQRQPRHPNSLGLARVLLEAGANANDNQTLYNRMFSPENEHLELLFEFGLGGGDGGPWKQRLDDALDSPIAMVRGQLQWAVTHGMVARTQLLIDHGVDIVTAFGNGQTPTTAAALSGHAAIVALLVANGALPPELDAPDALIAAALADDRTAVERIRGEHPAALADARERRPGLVVWATAQSPKAIALLIELGFDVNALGRSDTPIEQPWETALHRAASGDDIDLVRELLALGADPTIRDKQFDATPLGWAQYCEQTEIIELLGGGDPTGA